MLVGVNGTGKTTTAPKIAQRLLDNNISVVAAAETPFVQAQSNSSEKPLPESRHTLYFQSKGRRYSSNCPRRHRICEGKEHRRCLTDTVGTYKSESQNELNKVRRVADPHLTLFVGDSLAEDAAEQARMFQEIMKFDGAVLTKVDTDAKGGAGLFHCICYGKTNVPAGIGQGYHDLKQFDPLKLLEQMSSID